jgi:hypothetical protein
MSDLNKKVEKAIRHFWHVREKQSVKQGSATGKKDAGLRAAVTGGKHLDGFVEIFRELLREAGLPDASIHWNNKREIPGYFRPEKCWDLLVVADGQLLAIIEFKAQVGPSFGNNFNNRTEEVLGNATDLWAAYREGAFKPSQRPWLGYLFVLEECPRSLAPVKVKEPHFKVFPEFIGASYAKRYEILLTKIVRERLYDAACLLTTNKNDGLLGKYTEPAEELSFRKFAGSLLARAIAHQKTH